MDQWKKNRILMAWSLAWVYALLFHQLLIPFLMGSEINATGFVVTTIYFGVITFLVTWFFLLIPVWAVAIFLFVFGVFMETAVFFVIIDPILAGLFYIGMFFIPRWIARRMNPAPDLNESDTKKSAAKS